MKGAESRLPTHHFSCPQKFVSVEENPVQRSDVTSYLESLPGLKSVLSLVSPDVDPVLFVLDLTYETYSGGGPSTYMYSETCVLRPSYRATKSGLI